jgi:endonuclease/exonuclease/phosphatase family metal-dependent hydrolase
VLVRSWNLFHGNAVPPRKHTYLDDMVRLATADEPDIVCYQEIPAWALGRFTVGDVAARPSIGPVPISAELGYHLTRVNHGLIRSAFSGQGNAISVSPHLRVLGHRTLTLNARRFRHAQAAPLHLGAIARLAWANERRIVQSVRLADTDGRTYLVANLHATSYRSDDRLADAELLRAAWFAVSEASPEDVVILAGDFNVAPHRSRTLRDLQTEEWGFSAPGPNIDHILVRGASVTPVRVWPIEQRIVDGRLLSDHAPVELDIE